MQWERRKRRYPNESQLRAPEIRPPRLARTTRTYLKGNLNGPKPHPASHSAEEDVAFMHRQPRIEYAAIDKLKIRCSFQVKAGKFIQDDVKRQRTKVTLKGLAPS